MPLPSTIHLANYRAFAGPTELELRPLTLLYGWNSAGKTALLRSLPLLADSVRAEAAAALDLTGEAAGGGGFHDVKWMGPIAEAEPDALRLAVGFGWDAPAPIERAGFRLDMVGDPGRLVVRSFEVRPRGGPPVRGDLVPLPVDPLSLDLTYDVSSGAAGEGRLSLRFTGLIPEPIEALPVTRSLRPLLSELPAAVQWLRTGRKAPAKRILQLGTIRQRLGPDGTNTAEMLQTDQELRRAVSTWFEEHFQRRLDIESAPPSHFRLVLRSLRESKLVVDAADSGEGIVQVLPVLTAAELARRDAAAGRARILAIEEPESNLHPNAQRWLADHLSGIAAGSSPPLMVLETHAYAMLLAIQLQVVTGKLPADRVRIYWVRQLADGSSEACPVDLDAHGRPTGIELQDAFADQRTLQYELARERLDRENGP
jgi:predicted ATPase